MRQLFSILRIISFFALVVFLICKYAFSIELTIWLAVGYPFILKNSVHNDEKVRQLVQ